MRSTADKSAVAIYLRYFLSPSETFVYRQLKGVDGAFRPIVLTSAVRNQNLYPFEPVFVQGKGLYEKIATRLSRAVKGRYTLIASRQYRSWSRALTTERVRLIHAHFGHYGLDMLPLARDLGIPLLVTFHGMDGSKYLRDRRYSRDLAALFDYAHVITVSQDMARRLTPFGLNTDRADVHYIGIPVDEFDVPDRTPIREKIRDHELLRFLQVSNFVEKKGHRYTIDAFRRFVEKYPYCRLTLAGDGPLRPEIESMCAQKRLGEYVKFAGRVVKTQVSDLMRESDVFVHHSVTAADGDMEGIPTVIMEAMSTGLVVISTIHSGIPELIDDGIDGYLVAERDVDGYVHKLVKLAESDPELPKRARTKIEDKYNITKQNAKLVDIYEKVVKENAV
jgi:glycosyltransferase involved in cell wall biosynthesis